MTLEPLTPTTTHQEDLTVAGQRKVNLIWEYTQSAIALMVVLSNMVAALVIVFRGETYELPGILTSALFLIVGFYFARTNHQAIGGTGGKATDSQEYKGR